MDQMQIDKETRKEVEEKLKEIFQNINTWLHFGEAKNGALIAINIALLIGIIPIITNIPRTNCRGLIGYGYLCTVGLIVSIIISLLSFVPNTDGLKGNKGSPIPDDILMLFSHIGKYNEKDYIKEIYKRYYQIEITSDHMLENQEIEYAKEIIFNAKITQKKCKYFKIALYFSMLSIGGPLTLLILGIRFLMKEAMQ